MVVPQHIGFILDGNRRFAKRHMLKPWKGHELGVKKTEQVFEWCRDLGVKEATLYCFSIENFNRSKNLKSIKVNVEKKQNFKICSRKKTKNVHKLQKKTTGKKLLTFLKKIFIRFNER